MRTPIKKNALFSTPFLEDVYLYFVDSAFLQIVWNKRVETLPAVGATTPPVLYSDFHGFRRLVRVTRPSLYGQGPNIPYTSLRPPCPNDYQDIPPSAQF